MNRTTKDSKIATVSVNVNDQLMRVPVASTLSMLLDGLTMRGGPVAVELNQELVPADRFQSTKLKDGDSLEVVSLTGGG